MLTKIPWDVVNLLQGKCSENIVVDQRKQMISGQAVGHIAFDIFVDYLAKIGKHRALGV
jgi:hypothetical protein